MLPCCSGSPSLRVVCSPKTGAHRRELSINPYQQRTREHRRTHETTGPDTKYIWVRHRKAIEQSQSRVRPKERLTQQAWQEQVALACALKTPLGGMSQAGPERTGKRAQQQSERRIALCLSVPVHPVPARGKKRLSHVSDFVLT